jgi:hypothetical protein
MVYAREYQVQRLVPRVYLDPHCTHHAADGFVFHG